jgi:hypothetical protein
MIRAGYGKLRRGASQLLAVATIALATGAYGTTFAESGDFSNDPAHPTVLGSLTPGNNIISGTINTFGTPVGPHGELSNQDVDYMTFTVPVGDVLSQFLVSNGTTISTSPRTDSMFLGLAAGNQVNVDPSFTSASGLLGWTLVSQGQLGTDILPAIGASSPSNFPPIPGATTFTPPLGAGTYTLWLQDGDAAANYSFNAVVSAATGAVPEPGTWMQMIAGFGLIGAAYRFGRRARRVIATPQL